MRDGATAKYIYDKAGNLLAETNNAGVITRYYIHGQGMLAFVEGNAAYTYHHDAVGNTMAVTDGSGAVKNAYAYTPYGRVTNKQEAIAQTFQFAGQFGVMTETNGLLYMRARYYDPKLGRFLSEDPSGFDGGLNLYAYTGGNPVMRVDPSGLAVGDWWDLPANFGRAQQIATEELALRPSSHNDMGDAMRHSEWMRRTTQETNIFTAWVAGTGHEIEGTLKGQPLNEMLMDLHNNSIGRQAGGNNSSVDPGNLWTLPLNGPMYNNNYSTGCGQ